MNDKYIVREMQLEDYEKVRELWMSIQGFCIRSIDDSREGVERFVRRNPTTSIVAQADENIIGAILCGHDGRRGCLYHVCVAEEYRKHGVGKAMVTQAIKALKKEQINKIEVVAFTSNEVGNHFWKDMGWTLRDDLNRYDLILNNENKTKFNI
jgi:ribosomal protein S18 acetylase RimI-like enzyme